MTTKEAVRMSIFTIDEGEEEDLRQNEEEASSTEEEVEDEDLLYKTPNGSDRASDNFMKYLTPKRSSLEEGMYID